MLRTIFLLVQFTLVLDKVMAVDIATALDGLKYSVGISCYEGVGSVREFIKDNKGRFELFLSDKTSYRYCEPSESARKSCE